VMVNINIYFAPQVGGPFPCQVTSEICERSQMWLKTCNICASYLILKNPSHLWSLQKSLKKCDFFWFQNFFTPKSRPGG